MADPALGATIVAALVPAETIVVALAIRETTVVARLQHQWHIAAPTTGTAATVCHLSIAAGNTWSTIGAVIA